MALPTLNPRLANLLFHQKFWTHPRLSKTSVNVRQQIWYKPLPWHKISLMYHHNLQCPFPTPRVNRHIHQYLHPHLLVACNIILNLCQLRSVNIVSHHNQPLHRRPRACQHSLPPSNIGYRRCNNNFPLPNRMKLLLISLANHRHSLIHPLHQIFDILYPCRQKFLLLYLFYNKRIRRL